MQPVRVWARLLALPFAVALLLTGTPALALVTRLIPLREVLHSEQFIFAVKVAQRSTVKPAVKLQVAEDLKGKVPFRTLWIPLPAEKDERQGKETTQLLKRLAPDLPLLLFVSKRGQRYTAFAFTNGSWFQFVGRTEPATDAVQWSFTHAEPYLRRTFKGTTAELKQIVIDGLAGRKTPPEPDPREPPGLGPEIKHESFPLPKMQATQPGKLVDLPQRHTRRCQSSSPSSRRLYSSVP
jgi:hypothetical protein